VQIATQNASRIPHQSLFQSGVAVPTLFSPPLIMGGREGFGFQALVAIRFTWSSRQLARACPNVRVKMTHASRLLFPVQALIHFFAQHPTLALTVVFAAALLEAVAVVDTVIPGSSVVIAAGVLIGLQVLNPWWTAGVAVIGATLRDGFRLCDSPMVFDPVRVQSSSLNFQVSVWPVSHSTRR